VSVLLHPGQSQVFKDLFIDHTARNAAVCCSRGWGKSFMAGMSAQTAVVELMNLPDYVPNKNVFIIAPTYDQVTDIYYPLLMHQLDIGQYAIKASRELGRFVFPGNVELRLVSFEAIERMRGKGAYYIVWDEITSCTRGLTQKEAWEAIIQPCIITRWSPKQAKRWGAPSAGRALIISTPSGYDFFYDMFNFSETDELWASYQFDYTETPLIDPDEVDRIKHTIDPIKFASEYLASFADSGNRVFYCFDRQRHIDDDIPYFVGPGTEEDEGETVHCAMDFNVGIQATSFHAIRDGVIYTLDEVQGHPDTETLAGAIAEQFRGHKIVVYPDPTGKSRKTSAPIGRTDFSILKDYGFDVRSREKSPPLVDSVNAVNRMFLNAAEEVRWYIHPRCQNTIKSFERTRWVDNNPNTATIDKSENLEHFSDGCRYMAEYLFPIRSNYRVAKRGFKF